MFKRRHMAFGRRRFAKPVAHKRLIWCTTRATATEVAGSATPIVLLSSSQWEDNTTSGNTAQYCKVIRSIISLTATPLATFESRTYALDKDDVGAPPSDPSQVAHYSSTDCVHFGVFQVGATAAATGANQSLSNNYLDNVRVIKVNRRFKQDDVLWLVVSPAAAAGDQLSLVVLARTLVQLG